MKNKNFRYLSEIKTKIQNINFGLKDFNKTYNKYRNYKPDRVKEFFSSFEEEINHYLENELKNQIENKIYSSYWLNSYNEFDKLNKSQINMFKTSVNGITFHLNNEFIEGLNFCKNKNELRVFTILFYLKFYDKINSVMSEYFNEFYFDNFDILHIENKEEFKKYLILNSLD